MVVLLFRGKTATHSPGGEVSPVRVGKVNASDERHGTGKPMTIRSMRLENSGVAGEDPQQ